MMLFDKSEQLDLTDEQNALPSDLYYPSQEDLVEGTETIYRTPIDGVFFMGERVFEDSRGSFTVWARRSELEHTIGRPFEAAQGNLSKSREGVIRGIHAEYEDKLVTVTSGKVMAAIVDCRPDSRSSKTVVKVLLGDNVDYGLNSVTRGSLFIEGKGIGNSFIVLDGVEHSDGQRLATYSYIVGKEYSELTPAEQQPLYMFDPTLGINWPTNLSIEDMLNTGLISQRDLLAKDGGSALEWEEFIGRRRT